ncbi:hypothetical protein C8R45DRAFT_1114423 [Mycena sanguinolenta]|nr:hypothetical protein C8R45DRAFT_1114423 [Mycena sanguinolenta]
MSEDNLSDTTDEEPVALTPAQKSAITRARNAAQAAADAEKLHAETCEYTGIIKAPLTSSEAVIGGRVAKQKANANKVWKPSASVAIDPSGVTNTRKRAASAASVAPEQAKGSKRSRARKDQDPDSGMEVDEVPAVAKAKDKTKPNQAQVPKAADGASSTGKSKAAATRKYIPIADDSDEDSSGNIPVDKPRPQKPTAKATVPKQQAKPKNAAPSEYAEEDVDSLPSQSEEDEPGSEPASQSDQGDEEFPENPLDEDAILIPSSKKSDLATDDKELDLSDVESPSTSHRRQASSSSMGSMPPDTDYDFNDAEDDEEEAAPAPVDDDEAKVTDDEDIARPTTAPRKRQNTTAQQSKYAQENPEIRNSKVVHGTKPKEIQAAPESTWPSTARITFPLNGGQIKLLAQNATLQGIVKAAIKRSLYEIAFKDGYCDIAVRGVYARRLLRLCAKQDDHGAAVEKRAKADTKFCTLLAPLICARGGNLRTGLRNSAMSKVATHYGLNKPGISPSHIRSIVKQLKENQRFIFPYSAPPIPAPPVPRPEPGVAIDSITSNLPKVVLTFINDSPFHAPAIIDIIHDGWWSTPKSFGFKNIDKLISNRADRPEEIVLPDPMICLAGANVWAALNAWETGHFVHAKEFSQARLENTYKALLDVMRKQRSGQSAKSFNRTMHQLYTKISHLQAGAAAATSGSANNIICLPIDSD